jgi:hypothetical protein
LCGIPKVHRSVTNKNSHAPSETFPSV